MSLLEPPAYVNWRSRALTAEAAVTELELRFENQGKVGPHRVIARGAAHTPEGELVYNEGYAGGSGHAKCSCGWISPRSYMAGNSRKTVHREHTEIENLHSQLNQVRHIVEQMEGNLQAGRSPYLEAYRALAKALGLPEKF